jgi:hypothetical protein
MSGLGTLQLSIWRAFFVPAFWLATSLGSLFLPDAGREPADAAMILKNHSDPTISLSVTFRVCSGRLIEPQAEGRKGGDHDG